MDTNNNRLFIGNVPFGATEEDIKAHFEKTLGEGSVTEVRIIRYKDTGKSRGFAFITVKDAATAKIAIEKLHEQPLETGDVSRNLIVAEAKPSQPRQDR